MYNKNMKICVKDVVKKNGKRKMMALILLFLAVSATAVAVLSIKHREFRLVIDGEQISEEEFLQAMGEVEFQVISYFRSQYDADTDGDFWTRDFKGEVPYRKLAEAAVSELRYRYAAHGTAEEKGYIEHMTYAERQEHLKQANKERAAAKESGEVIYGLTEYSMEQYLDRELSLLKERYCGDSSNQDMNISEEELRDYYENGGAIMGEDGQILALEEVRTAVEGQMRQLRYDEMIQERAKALRVEADDEQLLDFTLEHL